MNFACRTPPKVWTREPILAVLVPLRYISFSFINGKLWLKQSVGLLPGKLSFKQIKMPRDQCRSCLSGCVHLLSEHVCPCVFICIPELACGWIIHKVKGLLRDGTHFENTHIYLHLFVTCLSVFTARIPAVGLRGRHHPPPWTYSSLCPSYRERSSHFLKLPITAAWKAPKGALMRRTESQQSPD